MELTLPFLDVFGRGGALKSSWYVDCLDGDFADDDDDDDDADDDDGMVTVMVTGYVAKVKLPQRVPFGFHGNWVSDASVAP